ncbi:65-kDa microtubule-associated protein 1 [Ananas comosus]|uniref:65-kDa microtubule-associated protein 1 n=1 Tax=Ananas comosus TaxID=4615 RepID=A0A199UM85_ANACO|nr:65-kDa microtubule-associated protein 1 [Ananas comosus]
MAVTSARNPSLGETTCGSLLQQLQQIWNEVGENDENGIRFCFSSTKSVGRLQEKPEKSSGTIKEQLAAIAPTLEQLTKQKDERIKEFADVQSQIEKICGEIAGTIEVGEQVGTPSVDEDDLSLEKLEDFHSQLQDLQKEKSDRQQKVLDYVSTVHDLCTVLGMDFFSTITEVHRSLDDSVGVHLKSISNDTLSKLDGTVAALKDDKKMRLRKLQDLAAQLSDLWNLMETPAEERSFFDHVTCNISATVDDAEAEVERLDALKASKMKEIALKKQSELEDIYASAHIEIDTVAAQEKIMSLIDSGKIEPSELIADMDNQILKAKEEALSRKEILDKVEKWMSACEEESWLEDYNRDENRYNSSRGAHLNLKRAEKARVLVNKIPALVDTLVAKTRAWEEDRSMSFMYDGVPLLAMLDEYVMLRHEREEEKRRMRDQKRFSEQQTTPEQSASRPLAPKKVSTPRSNGSPSNGTPTRRLSLNSHQNGSNGVRPATKEGKRENARLSAPPNHAAAAKEETASPAAGNDSIPTTP